jgi:regulator of PEP synthase PpsR (kinase-PPPase family)
MAKTLEVFVVSDATGATAEAVVTSVLVQFPEAEWTVRRFSFVRNIEQLAEVIAVAPAGSCVIVFTFVSRELADALVERAGANGLPVIDILTPLISVFAEVLGDVPQQTPGVFRRQRENMFKVASAIDFTLQHDDGKGQDTLAQADLIILGASRSGKTPTSIYLSCRNLKVANIPIIKDIPLPDGLARLTVPKVGLRMGLDRQLQLRSARARQMGTDMPWYTQRAEVFAEIDYCERVFRSIPGIHIIEVTHRSVEEVSDWIVRQVL